jgi:hypothetical protein
VDYVYDVTQVPLLTNFSNFFNNQSIERKSVKRVENFTYLVPQFHNLLQPSPPSLVFGSASAPPRGEWTRTGITFGHHSQDPYPFGIRCPKNATRGLQSVVQAFIIKHLIFDNRPKEKSVPMEKLLKPTESEQINALWNSLSEILWNVGEKTKTFVCLPGDGIPNPSFMCFNSSLSILNISVPHISHSHQYFQDNITEKVWL